MNREHAEITSSPRDRKQTTLDSSCLLKNPISRLNLPDPSIISTENRWHLFATCTDPDYKGRRTYVQRVIFNSYFHSEHRIQEALPELPPFARTDEIWAPHVVFNPFTNEWLMFYSVGPNEQYNESHIAVARTKDPTKPFIPDNKPLLSGPQFSILDAQGFIGPDESGKLSLFVLFGSAFQPIQLRELTPDAREFAPRSDFHKLRYTNGNIHEILLEGPDIVHENNTFCLVASGDNTWEPDHYGVTGFSSRTIYGPYTGMGEIRGYSDNCVWKEDRKYDRIGHTTFFRDATNKLFIIGFAVERQNPHDPANKKLRRMPVISPVRIEDNFLYINGRGTVPDYTQRPVAQY